MLGTIPLAKRDDPIAEFEEFESAWYSQKSTAIMSEEDGKRNDCSDAVDATGHYVWHENGEKEGECAGIDFEQAGKKWRAKQCNDSIVCGSASISSYVSFAYDAGIAMAIGLDKLISRQGISPSKITANLLFNATRNSSFAGSSGPVSFTSAGDRHPDAFKFAVFNYHIGHGFRPVGKMLNGKFVSECEGDPCEPMVFSDGTSRVPAVRVRHDEIFVVHFETSTIVIDICAALLQVVLVGGLFAQFTSNGEQSAINQAGVRQMAAVQMAINRVNNKHDGLFDELLPLTQVRLGYTWCLLQL